MTDQNHPPLSSPPPFKPGVLKPRSPGLSSLLANMIWPKARKISKDLRRKALGLTGEEVLEQAFADAPARIENEAASPSPGSPVAVRDNNQTNLEVVREATGQFCQWACQSNGVFRPTHTTKEKLPPGTYRFDQDPGGVFLKSHPISTDSLIVLDDTASQRVVRGIRTFWQSRASYRRYGLTYKRGILLFGPAGSGKTGTIMLLTQELVAMGGIVIFVSDPHQTGYGLVSLRAIEPDRPLILVFEDIDELIKQHGEHMVLALLDGEFQIPNVVSLASTNYPERLGPRIINRPSRFDERIFVDTPNELARRRYLVHITRDEPATDDEIARWIADSAGFSIAHLREMVIAVRCLGQEYQEVVARLKSMGRGVKAIEDYPGAGGGFGGGSPLAVNQWNGSSLR